MFSRLQRILRSPKSLREHAISASLWNVGAMVARYPLRLAGNLIMAQLLAPEAFGLMATVAALQIGLALFSDVGIIQSVMRSPRGDTTRFLRTAWVVQILRGFLIAGILILIGLAIQLFGPWLSGPGTVYADPRLPWLIWASSPTLIAAGFQSTAILLAHRRMRLGGVMAIQIASQVAGIAVMIGIGLVVENVWALVAGAVAGSFTLLALSHAVLPGPRMRFTWDRAQVTEMWSFGKWLIWASIGGFLISNGDRLIFAALIDKTLFGVYAIAVLWVEVGTQLLQKIADSVFIPSFRSVLSNREGRIGRVLVESSKKFALLSVLITAAVTLISILCIRFLYDAAYHAAELFIVILSFRTLLQMFLVFRQYTVFRGDSRYSAATSMAAGVLSLAAATLAYLWFGLEWAAFVFAVGWAPVYVAMLVHRDVRQHIDPRLHLFCLMAMVAGCALVTAWIDSRT